MGSKRRRSEVSAGSRPGNGNTSDELRHNVKKTMKKRKTAMVKHQVSKVKIVANKPQEAGPLVNPTALANSNWKALKSTILQTGQRRGTGPGYERKHDLDVKAQKTRMKQDKQEKRVKARVAGWVDNARIVAMDCEMVGVGLSGKTSVLARCSIVDYEGNVLYDKHVRPVEKVTDFRTHVSGIRSSSLRNAIPFAQCIKEVGKHVQDKIIVGHALKNDFQALMFTPPKHLLRDTALYRPYMRRKINGTKLYPKSLKNLAEEVLGKQIQVGQHDSVKDARATLELYKHEQFAWEKYLRTSKSKNSLVGVAPVLPEKEVTVDPSELLSATAKSFLDSDDDEICTGRRPMTVPDAKELALMEYGE
uniref:RNA exonuclease 4 n=1 Tax=Peronospora matthiolae TaxID=2874970 RepID=A0AAV1TPK2_9STRA